MYPHKTIICVLIQAEEDGKNRILRIADELKIPVYINEPERAVRALKSMLTYYEVNNNKDE